MIEKQNNNNILYRNYFLLIVLIILSIVEIGKCSLNNNKYSKNAFRKLITGYDIVKQINEQCMEDTNILKYKIVLNSTAFLYNLNISSRRILYSSIKELDGKNIGVEQGKTFSDLIKINFPKSEIFYYNSPNSLTLALLQNKIEAFLLEEIVAKYWTSQMNLLTYFKDKISYDNYAFGFPKGTNDKILSEFNQYLSDIKKDNTYEYLLQKWTNDNNSIKTIEKDFIGLNGKIKVGLNTNVPPFAYIEDNEIIGFEVDLLYRFAQKYGYDIEIKSLTIEEQINKLINDRTIDLVGGCFCITEQRKMLMNFTDSIYEGGAVVVTRNEKINSMPTNNNDLSGQKKVIVKNQHNSQNYDNIFNFPVNLEPDGQSLSGTCVFPENLTEIYTFECAISGLNEQYPMTNGFKYGLITDYIEVNGIVLNPIYPYIPSHIIGNNNNKEIEHEGTICPKINVYLAGVDNIIHEMNTVSLGFNVYRKSIDIPETQGTLLIKKGSSSCFANCQEEKNKIYLNSLSILVRYICSCTFSSGSGSSSKNFYANFDTMSFNYKNDTNKIINMKINNKEMTKNAMSNLYNNNAQFPNNLINLNTFLAKRLFNGRCIDGKFTFNALGILYKSISQEQYFTTNNPLRQDFILKIPYDLEEAEIQISINAKLRGILIIRKDYYENENNKGEYLYLTSYDDIKIDSIYCEGNTPILNNSILLDNNTYSNNGVVSERVETISLRDEMSMPKWLIILLVLLIAMLVMVCIYYYIQKMDSDVEYVIKYTNKNKMNVSTNSEMQPNTTINTELQQK